HEGALDPEDAKTALAAPPGSIAEGAARAAAEDSGPAIEAGPLDGESAAPAHAGPLDAGPLDAGAPGSVSAASAQTIAAAYSTLEDAAMRGDPVAQYEYGLARLAAGDSQKAVVYLRRAASQGLAMAQYRLAKLYERGEGVPIDLAQARHWTERAAAGGNRKAMHDLGVYYARGEGAPFDEATAFKWFRQAAEYGVADSQFNLGVLYSQGRGVTADQGEAYYWFSIAAAGGDSDARARAAMIAEKLDPSVIAKAKARAQAFRAKPVMARANGDFGKQPWAPQPSMEAAADAPPRT
ncbi:MAG TPA: tetratricopeptide repeat protein, partial [Caulobacterales bacterium]|nr:tetratricopeptide repeat protein [Caulobacterales bacterium]